MTPTIPDLDTLKNKREVRTVVRILNDVNAGKKVSNARLERAQALLLGVLEECNSKRPRHPVPPCTP